MFELQYDSMEFSLILNGKETLNLLFTGSNDAKSRE